MKAWVYEEYSKLTKLLIKHSLRVQQGETVLIDCLGDVPPEFELLLAEMILNRGAVPIFWRRSSEIDLLMSNTISQEQMDLLINVDAQTMQAADCYLRLNADPNRFGSKNIPDSQHSILGSYFTKVHREIRLHKKWCVTELPTAGLAVQAGMSLEDFQRYYFRVTNGVDYDTMGIAMLPLQELLQKTSRLRFVGPGDTNLEMNLSPKIGIIRSFGRRNMPCGEVWTAPIKDSANGILHIPGLSIYHGHHFRGLKLIFNHGQVTDCFVESGNLETLLAILDTDEGARFIGEIAWSLNPYIDFLFGSILFDEKRLGFHLALGNAYEIQDERGFPADNTNRSQIHWDIIADQSDGGQIFFDDVLVRQGNIWLPSTLQILNPDQLKKIA